MYQLITIDIWDTLLRRDCHPECIKLATAHHLLLGWNIHLKRKFKDVWKLYEARLYVERMLAQQAKACGNDDEYEISDVLSKWVHAVLACPPSAKLTKHLVEIELKIEIARSYPDPEIGFFLRSYQAERIYFLSDFYMGTEILNRILLANGWDKLVPKGFSSCDLGKNKRSGQIFRHIHNTHAITPQDHLHIGDNEWSDVASPRALGVHALHYQPSAEHSKRIANERLFLSRNALFEHIQAECAVLEYSASQGMARKEAIAFTLGTQSAPLFIGFALWVAEQCIIQKFDQVYFFTREGEFFHKIFTTLFPQGQLCGHELPNSQILAVSRLSTFSPSMATASISEMLRIWSLFKVQSITGLFTTLGLDVSEFSRLLSSLGLKKSDVIDNPKNSLELHRLFEAEEFEIALKKSMACQADLLRSYLIKNGIAKGAKVGIVDIGWRGTIQDNIALLNLDTHFHGMYLGLRHFINSQPKNVTKAAFGPDENISSEFSDIFTNFAVMEMLCCSPNGTTLGYCYSEDGCVTPRRQLNQQENTTYSDFVEPFQKGVFFAAKNWQSYLERYALSSIELRDMSLHAWRILCKTPVDELVQTYLHTLQNDVFGYGEFFKRNQYPSLSTIFLSPIIASKRRKLIEFIRRVQWSEAIKSAKDITPFHRAVLLFTFRLAHWIKHKVKKFRIIMLSNNK